MLLTLLALLFTVPSRQAPQPHDQTETVGWVSDPNGRGTFGLVSSCVFTLTLCVWSAMHLNIPPQHKTYSQRVWHNTKWIVLGILIPELVILSAWRQWLSARRMTKEMNVILEEQTPLIEHLDASGKDEIEPLVKEMRHEWTFVHSLYAGMGGFVFDPSLLPQGDDAFIPDNQRLHLTPLGVLLLARCGMLPNISLQDIKDKSKADGLAKTIVCVQAGWMVLQTLGRVAGKQPVTLLEVNTLGHVFCSFIVYLLWWQKPKEVNEPTIIVGAAMPQLCAYFYCSSRISGPKPNRWLRLSSWTEPELTRYVWHCDRSLDDLTRDRADSVVTASSETIDPERALRRFASASSTVGATGALLEKPGKRPRRQPSSLAKKHLSFTYVPVPDDTEHKRRIRQILASLAMRTFGCLHEEVFCTSSIVAQDVESETADGTARLNWSVPKVRQLVAQQASDWPSDYYLPGIAGQLMGMVLWLTAMCYGAVHAAAWSDYFPTRAEKMIWRFSSIFIASSSAFWFVMNALAAKVPWTRDWYHRFVALEGRWWEYVFCVPIATACGFAYIFARCFLVIGAVDTSTETRASLAKIPTPIFGRHRHDVVRLHPARGDTNPDLKQVSNQSNVKIPHVQLLNLHAGVRFTLLSTISFVELDIAGFTRISHQPTRRCILTIILTKFGSLGASWASFGVRCNILPVDRIHISTKKTSPPTM